MEEETWQDRFERAFMPIVPITENHSDFYTLHMISYLEAIKEFIKREIREAHSKGYKIGYDYAKAVYTNPSQRDIKTK